MSISLPMMDFIYEAGQVFVVIFIVFFPGIIILLLAMFGDGKVNDDYL